MTATSELRAQSLRVAGTLDPEVMTGEQAAAAVEDLAVAEHAVSGALMFAALRVARTSAWQGRGHRSAADWLAGTAGVSVAEAYRLLGTAEKAEKLTKTKEAMRNGDLSASQADAVAGAATAGPDAEEDLLDLAARDTHRNLRNEAAKRKAAATDSAERERRIRRNRSLRTGTDAEGAFWTRTYGPGVDGAAFEAMIRPFEELVFRQHRTAGIRSTYENRRHDAFFLMLAFYAQLAATQRNPVAESQPAAEPEAEAAEPSGITPTETETETRPEADAPEAPAPSAPPARPPRSPGSPGSGSDPDDRVGGSPPTWRPPWDPAASVPLPTKLPGGDNVKVIVLVDHTALLRGHTEAGETCEIAGVGPISVDAARHILANDPFLAVVVRKGIDIINVAHHGRGLNAAQRTAIEASGLRCRNIACNNTIALQIDHRVPYATDPTTALDNAEPHCPHCHDLKTHHGWHLEDGTGRRRFLPPGHPDNPLTDDELDQARGSADGRLPTGRALTDLINERPLTDDELDQLQTRVTRRLEARGHRVEQPTLC